MATPATAEPARRLRLALEMFDLGVAMKRAQLHRRHPQHNEMEIDEALVRWLHHRPGAEHGDAPGRPAPWPREPR